MARLVAVPPLTKKHIYIISFCTYTREYFVIDRNRNVRIARAVIQTLHAVHINICIYFLKIYIFCLVVLVFFCQYICKFVFFTYTRVYIQKWCGKHIRDVCGGCQIVRKFAWFIMVRISYQYLIVYIWTRYVLKEISTYGN